MSADSGAAAPAPLPDALIPTINGTRNAIVKTGPMKPTDCATASIRVSFFLPPRRGGAWVSAGVVTVLPPRALRDRGDLPDAADKVPAEPADVCRVVDEHGRFHTDRSEALRQLVR